MKVSRIPGLTWAYIGTTAAFALVAIVAFCLDRNYEMLLLAAVVFLFLTAGRMVLKAHVARALWVVASSVALFAALLLFAVFSSVNKYYWVFCPLCTQVADRYYFCGWETSVWKYNGCYYRLQRKYIGAECDHRWQKTGALTYRNLFGKRIACGCGRYDGLALHLYDGEELLYLEKQGHAHEVKLALLTITHLGRAGDLRSLDRFIRELSTSRQSQEVDETARLCRIINGWAKQLGVQEPAEDSGSYGRLPEPQP